MRKIRRVTVVLFACSGDNFPRSIFDQVHAGFFRWKLTFSIFLRFAAHISKDLTMTQLDRRKFMKMMGVTAAGTAGLSMLPPAIQKALAIAPNRTTGTIKDVEHVVILMQENRSFDHYFGTYNGVRGYTDPRPVRLPSTGKPTWFQPNTNDAIGKMSVEFRCGVDPKAEFVAPYHIDSGKNGEWIRGTPHGEEGMQAWNKGNYDRWLEAKKDVLVMGHLRHEDVSYHRHLANSFTICDHYFSSFHGSTDPNRTYLWTGTASDPALKGTKGFLKGWSDYACEWKTYPERLEDHNKMQADKSKTISWRVYQGGTGRPFDETDNFDDNPLERFRIYAKKPFAKGHWANGICYVPGLFGRDWPQLFIDHSKLPPLTKNGVTNRTLFQVAMDARNGTLPNISWVVAPRLYSEHTKLSTNGAYYINSVLDALVANRDVWSKTVFIINYDENDGYFDHVVPPMPPIAADDGSVSPSLASSIEKENLGGAPMGFGPRVPCLVISPWSRGGWVCSQVFDHTSVLQFLEARFGVEETNITPWRRAVAGDLTSALDFAGKPDRDTAGLVKYDFTRRGPPGKGKSPKVPRDNTTKLPELDDPFKCFPDHTSNDDWTRKARPLPYQFCVTGLVEPGPGWLTINMHTKSAGTHFYIYDNILGKHFTPKRYTLVKDEPLTANLRFLRDYNFSIYGPNGFLCEYAGKDDADVDAKIVVTANAISPRTKPDLLPLQIILNGAWPEDRYLKIRSAYRQLVQHDGTEADFIMVPLPLTQAADPVLKTVEIPTLDGWYDVLVEFTDKKGKPASPFKRRCAGHLETGEASRTDPGMVMTYDPAKHKYVKRRPSTA
jgi:phospholipase C